jgi:predicted phage baseplate assembly protein
MSFPLPVLDDRSFQDILDEARRLIPRFCPEWTDHNLSDPGITLLELFAWMTDISIYRLNRVPEKNHIAFLNLIGMRRNPARPASADVIFRLTAAQPEDLTIPAGTEIATEQTDALESIGFATDRDLVIRVPKLTHVLASRGTERFYNYQPALARPDLRLGVFSDTPIVDDAFYLGFRNDLNANSLYIEVDCTTDGMGVDPTDPPLRWEVWDRFDQEWVRAQTTEDTTRGLNAAGYVIVQVPYTAGFTVVDGKRAFWVRVRVVSPRHGQAVYARTPRILSIDVESIGGIVSATQATIIDQFLLGYSDGSPSQAFQLPVAPVLRNRQTDPLEIESEDGTFEPWSEVPDFGSSGPSDKHYMLDSVTGTVTFGPRIRASNGREEQMGEVPLLGRALRFPQYWTGGGVIGNVGAGTISVVKSAMPYVAWCRNETPASGGTESEDLEAVKLRAPHALRARSRAVTAEDFEALAIEASPSVARAQCLIVGGTARTIIMRPDQEAVGAADIANTQPSSGNSELRQLVGSYASLRAHERISGVATHIATSAGDFGGNGPGGMVRLLIVPALRDVSGAVNPEQLGISAKIRQEVFEYLDDRRIVTSELVLGTPPYTWVSVAATVKVAARTDRGLCAERARQALATYIHPVVGGSERAGWPFGRTLYIGELYAILQVIDGVEVIEDVTLYQVDPESGVSGPPVTQVSPGDGGLLVSGAHRISVR